MLSQTLERLLRAESHQWVMASCHIIRGGELSDTRAVEDLLSKWKVRAPIWHRFQSTESEPFHVQCGVTTPALSTSYTPVGEISTPWHPLTIMCLKQHDCNHKVEVFHRGWLTCCALKSGSIPFRCRERATWPFCDECNELFYCISVLHSYSIQWDARVFFFLCWKLRG